MTEVGYTNGTLPNPTYEDVCSGETGHCETIALQSLHVPCCLPQDVLSLSRSSVHSVP